MLPDRCRSPGWAPQEGIDQAEDSARCKGTFEDGLAQVELVLTRDGFGDAYLVFFAWDQATLTPVALTVLDQVEEDYARGLPARIVIAGHADRSGSEAYNLGRSERHASTVADALSARGIPASIMTIEAFGESLPRVPTDGVREPQNRRVEIVFG